MSEPEGDVLSLLAAAQAQRDWRTFDAILPALEPAQTANEVSGMLSTLVDDPDEDGRLFAIVHLAEAAPDDIYVSGLITAMPTLITSAPRWACLLLIRTMNSTSAFEALLERVPRSTFEEGRALAEAASSAQARNDLKFGDKARQLRAAVGIP